MAKNAAAYRITELAAATDDKLAIPTAPNYVMDNPLLSDCSPLAYEKDMKKVIGDPVDHHKFPENPYERKVKRKKALSRWEKHFG